VILPLAACGSDSEDSADTAATPVAGTPADCAALDGVPAFSGTWGEAPEIPAPKGKKPTELATEDCLVGTGDTVGDNSVPWLWNYEGVAWSNGEVFDSSFERGEPIDFSLDQVIQGWQQGLQGMKVGGRRLLVIPSDLAYGEQGGGPIGPNEPLVFVVDLVGPAGA
jgi:peptidylprolyl isomerase